MNHTPGPWTQDEYGSVKTPSGETLLVEGVALAGRSTEETRANTRLIAAADDLLAACKAIVAWDEAENNARPYVEDGGIAFRNRLQLCAKAFDKARAAIKKAEGQS